MAEIDFSKFESISPYGDEDAVNALGILADAPILPGVSKYFFPEQSEDFLSISLKSVKSVDDFQVLVMSKIIERVLAFTAHNFSYDGINNLANLDGKKFLLLSNHRDIILDPAITQIVLYRNGLPTSEIAVGDNLITNKTIEYLIRSNKMIKVIRGVSSRELYLSSKLLSEYIRLSITSGKSSIWLAQRQGRTKNGADTTEQGLLKMLDMSGGEDFQKNFEELNIVPLSISYEFEPCDALKAREMLISRTEKYVKAEGEDLNSILMGIKQPKGNIHLNIGKPITSDEIREAAECDKNERYQKIRQAVDLRIIEGYKLWKNNYVAYDLLNHSYKYSHKYAQDDIDRFVAYMEKQLNTVEPELNRKELRELFLEIYANPVVSKEMLEQ
jgi:hypothetical protein